MYHPDVIDEHTDGDGHGGGDRLPESTCRPGRSFEAREAAARFLARLRPAPSAEAGQNLLLVVSELVTNAIRHAGGATVLRLSADSHSLRVTVEDPSPALPRQRTPDLTGRTGGFGWPMVQHLTRSVSVHPGPYGGKAVQAVLAR